MIWMLFGCFPGMTGEKPDNTGTDDTDGVADSSATDDTGDPWLAIGVVAETTQGTTPSSGRLKIPIQVSGGVFQVDALRPDGGYLSLEYIDDPSGNRLLDWEDWSRSKQSLTDAVFIYDNSTIINWPIREEDGPLVSGEYVVTVGAVDEDYRYEEGVEVQSTLLQRADSDFAKGTFRVLVVLDSEIEQDISLREPIEASLVYWKELYGRYGVTLEYRTLFWDLETNLPATGWGDALYEELYQQASAGETVVVVGEIIDGDKWLYGEAGGIPGALVPTKRSAVAVSWLTCAGSDGVYSEEDVLFLGETMAHEVGHYLGMYHPVESSYNFWDAIEDTPECTTWQECEADMGDNLMFAYPLCDRNGVCQRQDVLSDDQIGIVQRNLAVVE
jgi:hypothetical protein